MQYEEEKERKKGQPKDKDEKIPYNKESRREMYLELAKEKEDKEREKNPDKFKPKVVTPMFKKDGEIRQCNEGKY